MGAETLVEARGLHRTFVTRAEQVHAVKGVDLRLFAGRLMLLTGPSGSGKSTLINLLAGLDTPDRGEIEVLGVDVVAASEKTRAAIRLNGLGVVFQDNNLIREFSALENVMVPLVARGLSWRDARDRSLEALDWMGVAQVARRRPPEMSGGQRQRVGIGRALVGDKRILLADEPTGALDQENSHALFRLLKQFADERSVAVLLCSHDPGAEDYCDDKLAIADGAVS